MNILGSPDRCPAMCEQWAERDNRIRVVHKANGGLSSARNAALNVASGEFVTFVDSDDYLDLDTYAPISDENYYLHVLNIQLDVARMTGNKPLLNSLMIRNPWKRGVKNGLKLSLFNIIGLRAMCSIYRLIYLIRRR